MDVTAPRDRRTLRFRGRSLVLDRPLVMGVLNVTPDSFSDGGRFASPSTALARADALVAAGADIVDVGGESTRPGAQPVAPAEEIERVLPVVEHLVRSGALVSVDTRNPATMQAVLDHGAHLINDISALRAPRALEVVARSGAAVCLMHMQGEPGTMQRAPHYADVVTEVRDFLQQRAQACEAAGLGADRVLIDPGFGFGKTLDHNIALLRGLSHIADLGWPVLVGLSRKSMLQSLTGRAVEDRLAGSLALAQHALARGAAVLRVHDVAQTADLVRVWSAVSGPAGTSPVASSVAAATTTAANRG